MQRFPLDNFLRNIPVTWPSKVHYQVIAWLQSKTTENTKYLSYTTKFCLQSGEASNIAVGCFFFQGVKIYMFVHRYQRWKNQSSLMCSIFLYLIGSNTYLLGKYKTQNTKENSDKISIRKISGKMINLFTKPSGRLQKVQETQAVSKDRQPLNGLVFFYRLSFLCVSQCVLICINSYSLELHNVDFYSGPAFG